MMLFISSPYQAVFNAIGDRKKAKKIALEIAKDAVKWAVDNGDTPISPVLLFDGVLTERSRSLIMQMCAEMIKKCDGVVCCNTQFLDYSDGMRYELDIAEGYRKTIFDYYHLKRYDV